MITPVILAGGSGTRLWPLSRELYPKQMLCLTDKHTMLQNTVLRLEQHDAVSDPLIVCNEEHRFMAAEQLRQIDVNPSSILLEPVGRNTAPAICIAALKALANGDDPVLLVLPADHVIADVDTFQSALQVGKQQSEAGKLVTFGVVPDVPETGFGYIKAHATGEQQSCYDVDQFVEKPDAETAASYIADGHYYWNSGMFMFRASTYLAALKQHSPGIYEASEAAFNAATRDLDFIRVGVEEFENCPSDSIDYAVMEKVDNAVVIPVDIGWNDVGSWSALHDVGDVDAEGNLLIGDVKSAMTSGSYVRANNRLVVTLGVDNMIVVDTDDALLVASRDNVQDIKTVVEQLNAENREEVNLHKCVYRPWGHYQQIDSGPHFQAKRITVSPGATLSLQMHHHRSEHWLVVCGTAKVTRGEEEVVLSENESTYSPRGMKHRLQNIGKIPLKLIEVQTGSYLGEDDIVRFEDIYGRNK